MAASPQEFTKVIDENKKLREANAKLREHNQKLTEELAATKKGGK